MTPSVFAKSILVCSTMFLAVSNFGAPPVNSDWDAENYFLQTQAGLEQNSITAVMQSRDGYLWVGTYTGLLRFDGVRFTDFTPGNSPGLRNGRIIKLFEDARGTVWLGHETGEVTELRNGVFTPARFEPSRPDAALVDINMDARGDVWILHG
ncbi:MAG: two-component regulator propeller domain-containing protein, partial [Verrucomicrobiota bacterium]